MTQLQFVTRKDSTPCQRDLSAGVASLLDEKSGIAGQLPGGPEAETADLLAFVRSHLHV